MGEMKTYTPGTLLIGPDGTAYRARIPFILDDTDIQEFSVLNVDGSNGITSSPSATLQNATIAWEPPFVGSFSLKDAPTDELARIAGRIEAELQRRDTPT